MCISQLIKNNNANYNMSTIYYYYYYHMSLNYSNHSILVFFTYFFMYKTAEIVTFILSCLKASYKKIQRQHGGVVITRSFQKGPA